MLVKKQETAITIAKRNVLKTLLETGESRELTKYVGTLSARKIHATQKEASEIMIALEYQRKQYKKLSSIEGLKGKELKSLKKDLYFCEQNGKRLAKQLETLSPAPSIREMAVVDEDDLIADLTLLLLDLRKAFNIGGNLSTAQVEHLAIGIMQRMGSFTLEDVALCFHRAKCGDNGKVYDRLDINVVNTWLNEYKKERKELRQMDQQNQHHQSKYGMSYDLKDAASIRRVERDRGVDIDKESHYEVFKADFLAGRNINKS